MPGVDDAIWRQKKVCFVGAIDAHVWSIIVCFKYYFLFFVLYGHLTMTMIH